MHPSSTAHRKALLLAAIVGARRPCCSRADDRAVAESNPNNYTCSGSLPPASRKWAAKNSRSPTRSTATALSPAISCSRRSRSRACRPPAGHQHPVGHAHDTFSCSGEVPGYADDCVGTAQAAYETIAGQFAIGTKLCAEPRVDAAVDGHVRLSRKRRRHAGDLRAVRPRTPGRLPPADSPDGEALLAQVVEPARTTRRGQEGHGQEKDTERRRVRSGHRLGVVRAVPPIALR